MPRFILELIGRDDEVAEMGRILYPDLGPTPLVLVNASFVLITLGQVSLVLLIGTFFFSSYVRARNATLLNLLALTIFASVPPGILYYSGHVLDPNPPFGLCLTQSAFRYGVDPMFIFGSLALIVELLAETRLLDIRFIRRPVRTALLVALPYFVFFVFFFWALALGKAHPSVIQHKVNEYYCSITYLAFCRGIDILNAVVVVFTIGLEIFMYFRYRQIWKQVPSNSRSAQSGLSTAPIIRVLSFTSLQLFYICLLALDFFVEDTVTHIIPIAYEALMPLATFLIFGTTKDCIDAWKFWERRPLPGPEDSLRTPPGEEADGHRAFEKLFETDVIKAQGSSAA